MEQKATLETLERHQKIISACAPPTFCLACFLPREVLFPLRVSRRCRATGAFVKTLTGDLRGARGRPNLAPTNARCSAVCTRVSRLLSPQRQVKNIKIYSSRRRQKWAGNENERSRHFCLALKERGGGPDGVCNALPQNYSSIA